MPVHNARSSLERALDSIARQQGIAWECVVVDDGSSDGSGDILDAYGRRDSRFKVVRLPHGGIVRALNAGVEQCRAPYIARMDADDVSHRDRLRVQVAFLESRPDIDVASCLLRKFPRPALRVGMLRYEAWLNSLLDSDEMARDMFVESPLAHPTAVMRRSTLERVGGYHDVAWAEDYDLWLRIHTAGGRFAKVPRLLFFWSDLPDRLSRTSQRYGLSNFRRCKVCYLRQGPLRGHDRVVVWGAGRTGKRVALALLEQGVKVEAFVELHPRKIGQNIHGAMAIRPQDLPTTRGLPVLVAVGKEGAREIIRNDLRVLEYVEGRDYWCVA